MARTARTNRYEPDSDLNSGSCMGLGVMYPELWGVVKRYILRGDEFYQRGGLSILADTAWNMPLGEATAVLEEYFAIHEYLPLSGPRGGVSFAALKAVYSVGTTYGFDDFPVEDRRKRMLNILNCYLHTITPLIEKDDELSSNIRVINDTIDAIKTGVVGFNPCLSVDNTHLQLVATTDCTIDDKTGVGVDDRKIIKALPDNVQREDTARDLEHPSQMDRIIAKHGYSILEQRISYEISSLRREIENTHRLFDHKFAHIEKQIDRFLSERQIHVGKSQIDVGKSQLSWAKTGSIVALITLLFALATPTALLNLG